MSDRSRNSRTRLRHLPARCPVEGTMVVGKKRSHIQGISASRYLVRRTGSIVWVLLIGSAALALFLAHLYHLGVPATLVTVLVGGGTLAGLYLAWVTYRDGQRRVDGKAHQALQGTDQDTIPLVKDSKELGARIHRAVFQLPYIRRDVEDEARAHLDRGQPVLLVGPSMVGKTQMAVKIVRDAFPDYGIVIPDSSDSLTFLETAGINLQKTVIFLDDINRLIGARGITDGIIRRLARHGNVIIGTIRAGEYDRYQPTNQLRPPEWDVLSVFQRVFVGTQLSDTEKDRVKVTVDDLAIREQIYAIGLGEYVGAAGHIEEALRLGPHVNAAGYALVRGAVDWRRAGMGTPVPVSVLGKLATPYLPARMGHSLDDETYQSAVQWATRDINPMVALLLRVEPDKFDVFHYALDVLSRENKAIPDATWSLLIQVAKPSDLITLGYTAELIFRQSEVALRAWRKAAELEFTEEAPIAQLSLGILLQEKGNFESAKKAYIQAVNYRHVDYSPMAAFNLAYLLWECGDIEAAKMAYRQVIDFNHADVSPQAAVNFGNLLQEQGDKGNAKIAYQRAIDSGHPTAAAQALTNLNSLRLESFADACKAGRGRQRVHCPACLGSDCLEIEPGIFRCNSRQA
jgi:tetratricopeptide (TPR) repeat protein